MKYRCIHRTGRVLIIENSNHETKLSGDPDVVKACSEYLDSFKNSYALRGEKESAYNTYKDLMIKKGNIWSVDVDDPRFVSKFLIPDLEGMGYQCIQES